MGGDGEVKYCTPRVVCIAFVYFSEKPPGSIFYIYVSQKAELQFIALSVRLCV